MPMNWFYLHFRNAPAPATLDLLREHCASVEPVFETSYRVSVPTSGASFRRFILFHAPQEEYCLVKYKDFDVVSPGSPSA